MKKCTGVCSSPPRFCRLSCPESRTGCVPPHSRCGAGLLGLPLRSIHQFIPLPFLLTPSQFTTNRQLAIIIMSKHCECYQRDFSRQQASPIWPCPLFPPLPPQG